MKAHKLSVILGTAFVIILGALAIYHLRSSTTKNETPTSLAIASSPLAPSTTPATEEAPATPQNSIAPDTSENDSLRSAMLAHKQDKIAARQLARTNPRLQPSGPSIVSGAESFQAIPGLMATQNPEPGTKIVARIGNFRVVETTEGGSNLQSFIPTTPPIVARSSDGKLGLVTGIVDVELRAMTEATDVARDAGLDVAQESPGTARVFLKVRAGSSIPDTLGKLRSDARVKSVELDILDSAAVAR